MIGTTATFQSGNCATLYTIRVDFRRIFEDRAFLQRILGQRDEELFMDKTMVESMPKFRLRHYSYHEKNWTYGGKLYNGEFS